MTKHFIRKPQQGAEWESEELFRMYCSMKKIDIVNSQVPICLTCGSMPALDMGGKCVICDGRDFTKVDFIVRGMFPVYSDGSVHEKQKVEERDRKQDAALINRGRLPIRVRSEDLKRALGK